VLAVGLVLLWHVSSQTSARERLRVALLVSPGVLLPLFVTVGLQSRASAASVNYTGTSVAVGDKLLDTTAIGLLGALPGAGWRLSWAYVGGPDLLFAPLAVLLMITAVLVVLGRGTQLGREGGRLSRAWLLVLAPLVYGVGATVIQTSTAKVQAEVSTVGMVYTFYAISASALAALLTLALLLAPRRALRKPWVAGPVAAVLVAVVLVQTLVNATISVEHNSTNQPQSRALIQAYSDELPEPQRCAALRSWTELLLPDYYEADMVAGLQSAYQHFHGEPFCTGFVR
ncbi:MAG: hypothetical protein H7233_07325, partial [Pseudorhodobacter sp.]|nr:hypothetical protein [Frankiaceae bacterium]